ncbi:hypothetical protein EKO04_008850 [Ascochyta lentis]|uniref:Uncharacterized protein n=1 Tax=Ascochyta lentis TaxID=205686 RepID=A0A8H7IYH3_9PLEO|nr:hypothetical protein EKO04_008850 [Ascochyta lentis]
MSAGWNEWHGNDVEDGDWVPSDSDAGSDSDYSDEGSDSDEEVEIYNQVEAMGSPTAVTVETFEDSSSVFRSSESSKLSFRDSMHGNALTYTVVDSSSGGEQTSTSSRPGGMLSPACSPLRSSVLTFSPSQALSGDAAQSIEERVLPASHEYHTSLSFTDEDQSPENYFDYQTIGSSEKIAAASSIWKGFSLDAMFAAEGLEEYDGAMVKQPRKRELETDCEPLSNGKRALIRESNHD